MRERCSRCGRLLPVGQLRRVNEQFVCAREAACKRAQLKQANSQTSQRQLLVPEGKDVGVVPTCPHLQVEEATSITRG